MVVLDHINQCRLQLEVVGVDSGHPLLPQVGLNHWPREVSDRPGIHGVGSIGLNEFDKELKHTISRKLKYMEEIPLEKQNLKRPRSPSDQTVRNLDQPPVKSQLEFFGSRSIRTNPLVINLILDKIQ